MEDRAQAAFYIAGGTLPATANSYVERQADKDLLTSLLAGQYCYVLNSRQMGKSSLCVRTMQKLREAGVRTVFLDLTKFGGRNLSAEQWYAALLSETGRELGMRTEFLNYWKANTDYPPVQRLISAITEIGLQPTSDTLNPIVVFIDEIDVTLNMPFSTDEFFAAIRQCYVGRATDENLKGLSFCLLGTATPADLIKDTRVSPFNIGKRIELRDFTRAEANGLGVGFGVSGVENSQALLNRILYWTNGHPYLTQRLCRAISESVATPDTPRPTPQLVDKTCTDLFLTHAAKESDDNFAFVRNRLLKSEEDLAALLDLYRKIRSGTRVPDDETNPICALLKLSGAANVGSGNLVVRNRIYEHVFDRAWVETHMPDAELRRQRVAYRRGVQRTLAIASAILVVMAGLSVIAIQKSNDAVAAKNKADQKATLARRAEIEASNQKAVADLRLVLAVNARKAEEIAKREALASARLARAAQLQALNDAKRANIEAGRARSAEASNKRQKIQYELTVINDELIGGDPLMSKQILQDRLSQDFSLVARQFEWRYMRQFLQDGRLCLHNRTIRDIAWCPRKDMAASADDGDVMKIWNPNTGRVIAVLKGHCVAFSPDGNLFASAYSAAGGKLGAIEVRETNSLAIIKTLTSSVPYIQRLAFSPNGAKLASTGDDGKTHVWDMITGVSQLVFSDPVRGTHVTFAKNNRWLAVGSQSNWIAIIDLDDSKGTSRRIPTGHGFSWATAFSPDSRTLATCGSDAKVRIWDVESGKPLPQSPMSGHTKPTVCIAYSPDGKYIASAGDDHTIRLWNSLGGIVHELQGPTHSIRCLTFSPDSRHIVGGGDDREVWKWDLNQRLHPIGKATSERTGLTHSAVSPNGRWVAGASSGGQGMVTLYDNAHQSQESTLHRHPHGLTSTAFSPDSQLLGVGCAQGSVMVWRTNDWKQIVSLSPKGQAIHAIAFDPRGRWMASGGDGGGIAIVECASGKIVKTKELPDKRNIRGMSVSPDGSYLAACCGSDPQGRFKVYILTISDMQILKVLEQSGEPVDAVAFSPNGRLLAAAGHDWIIRLWDTASWRIVAELRGHTYPTSSLTFTSDSSRLLSGSWDKTVRIWDLTEKRLLLKIPIPFTIHSVSLSTDDSTFVASGGDPSPWLLSIPTMEQIRNEMNKEALSPALHKRGYSTGELQKITEEGP